MSDYSRVYTEKRHRRRHAKPPVNTVNITNTQAIDIRIGNRRSQSYYNAIRVTSPRDGGLFQRLVDNTVKQNPKDPLLIVVNGHQPWLEEILSTCLDDHYSQPGVLSREVQFSDTLQFPQRSVRRSGHVPWTFIVDEMNVPDVYYWTFGQTPPDEELLADVDAYRFRLGGWTIGRGGYRGDDRITVFVLIMEPTAISESVVKELLFTHLYKDAEFDAPRKDEEGLCWLFLQLYDLLTDWQNIIREVERRLDEAEVNSRGRSIPVKLRTRTMHREVDRIYELNEYLRFHSRSFKKLAKLKTETETNKRDETIWDQMDDHIDDLDQYGYYLDSLKERFNNLIELEFNIENATQSDNSRYLGVLATLFLPISFLASLFGMTTVTWPPIWYLWAVSPIFFVSIFFTIALPSLLRRYQQAIYPLQKEHVHLNSSNFTLLGDQLPDSADVPSNIRYKNGGQRQKQGGSREPTHIEDSGGEGGRSRSRGGKRVRSRSVG